MKLKFEMEIDTKNLISRLEKIFSENKNKRVVVVGTTCTGKTYFIRHLKNTLDMDELIFPLLKKKEKDYVCQTPWTPEIGKTMIRLTREKVKVKPGHPVIGTVVLDCDLVIYLSISDELLKERCKLRDVVFKDAKGMQKQIEGEIKKAKVKTIKISVG